MKLLKFKVTKGMRKSPCQNKTNDKRLGQGLLSLVPVLSRMNRLTALLESGLFKRNRPSKYDSAIATQDVL